MYGSMPGWSHQFSQEFAYEELKRRAYKRRSDGFARKRRGNRDLDNEADGPKSRNGRPRTETEKFEYDDDYYEDLYYGEDDDDIEDDFDEDEDDDWGDYDDD